MTYPDFAAALQARLRAHVEADHHPLRESDSGERRTIEALEAQIATLQDAIASTEALGEQQRHEAGTAVTRVEALEADIATLKEAVTKAQALAEERRQEAETAARRVEALEAQIATLENAVANAEAPGVRRRQEAETAAKRVEVLEAHIAQVAIGIRLAIIMGEGRIAGLDLERLQGIADSVAGLKTVS